MRGNNCGGIVFPRGTSLDDVLGLFSLYHLDGPARTLEEARAILEGSGVRGVQLVDTHERPKWFAGGDGENGGRSGGGSGSGSGLRAAAPDAGEVQSAVPLFQDMFEMVEESLGRGASGDAVDVNAARTLGESLGQAGHYGMQNIMSLASYPDFDAYTVGHSIRVALLAVCVASRIGVEPELITELGAAGLLHDVGKSLVPYEILYKPAALDEEERREMSRHACLGAQILLGSEEAGHCAIGAAWGHHRRHDRRGYPKGHSWALPSKATSLLQVCDVFEALTAQRPYKDPLTPRRAYEVMLSDRGAFDPGALSTFIRQVGLYPPGYCVGLSDGHAARVVAAGSEIDKPRVRRLDDGELIDLTDGSGVQVARLLSEGEASDWVANGGPDVPSLVADAAEDRETDGADDDPVDPAAHGVHLCGDGCVDLGPDEPTA